MYQYMTNNIFLFVI